MKHSCCLQIHPEILLKYRERCADGMPLATETALTAAIEDNLCHLGAHEGGVSIPCMSDPVIALQLSGWIKPSPPGMVLKSPV